MTFLDLFAGIGGFRRGMELAGHRCVGFCEWDKYAAMSYISMHLITEEQREYLATLSLKERQKEILKEEYRNGEWYSNDIRNVDAGNVPQADCWCFGAPCQDFSVAGKRKGLDGDRSSLIREVFRILSEIRTEGGDQPEWLIYENVAGMLSSNAGRDYLEILMEMDKLGYDCEWFLFNSKYHGVPQNRERVYTIGHLRKFGPAKIFPLKGTGGENNINVNQIGKYKSNKRDNPNAYRVYDINECSPALNTMQGGGREPHICIPVLTPDRPNKRQNGRRFKENGDPAFTLTAQDRHGVAISVKVRQATKAGYDIATEGDSINFSMPNSKTRRGRVGKQVAQTLDTQCNQGIIVALDEKTTVYATWYEKYKCYIAIRKLTPRECFRLQGWPDDYFEKAEFVNSDSQLYKQVGNGVTTTVVYDIAKAIAEFI